MDPYEQRLRDEVIYLHSLWHQGPPRNPNPNHNPNPNPSPNPIAIHNPSSHQLQPINHTNFKRIGTTRFKKKPLESDPPPVSDVEWPCKLPAPTNPEAKSAWPNLKPHPTVATPIRLPSAEEQVKFAANQVLQKGLKLTQEFFASHEDSDNDNDEDMEDEDDVAYGDCEEYSFFLKVFKEDDELRGYYEKNCENGDFGCLVCCGIGTKVGKRFKNCVALVQHSITIAKTKKRRAHRAYGQVICKVLGWDVHRLPTIVLSLGDPLSHTLPKSCESQANVDGGTEHSDAHNKDSSLQNYKNGEMIPLEVSDLSQKKELLNRTLLGTSNVTTDDWSVGKEPVEVEDVRSAVNEMNKNLKDIIVFDGDKEIMKIRIDKEVVEVVAMDTNEERDWMVSLNEDGV
ncbi:uncharacterized protein LOC132308618 isoform X2 [Cornus florida]|uniref:uncharacterized protein LOC132308618 isoform X2 n=1 Tax=Cornus florida TaxID=4283 RepID=UPI00289E1A26|nr:uncharacterized protein LOC132308618 isoform X2 [Cornus florida]